MAREIKFRVWEADKHFWGYFNMYNPQTGTIFAANVSDGKWILMQYTDLHDKNGVAIWEGDIVKVANYEVDWKGGEPDFDWRVFEIQWNKYTLAFNNSVIYSPFSDYNLKTGEPYEIEVVGNVYENPELLNTEAKAA